ncbi:hypothetical protein CDAR_492811 [Caerostris darwini]|uniref:ATP synthase F0 subunit 8 n=1 Tax=Caerostris darwini TaxID=1538125 RepID=A0AAV4PB61_9ARAC|nr:hypothetical protein CDAR_492811 [Caerostris darwini]
MASEPTHPSFSFVLDVLFLFLIFFLTLVIATHPLLSSRFLPIYGDIEASEVLGVFYAPIDGKSCKGFHGRETFSTETDKFWMEISRGIIKLLSWVNIFV